MADNGKPEEKKQFEIQITCSPDTRQVGIRSNVKDMLLGLGMLEAGQRPMRAWGKRVIAE